MGTVLAVTTAMLITCLILPIQCEGNSEHYYVSDNNSRLGAQGIVTTRRREMVAELKPAQTASNPSVENTSVTSKYEVGLGEIQERENQGGSIKISSDDIRLKRNGDQRQLIETKTTDIFGFHHPLWKFSEDSLTIDLNVGVEKSAVDSVIGRREESERTLGKEIGRGRDDQAVLPSRGRTNRLADPLPRGRRQPVAEVREEKREKRRATRSHPPSPCPSVFSYLKEGPSGGKWYGNIVVTTRQTVTGVTLDIQLDKPALLLGAWLGGVETVNKKDFTVRNKEKVVKPGSPLSVKILVQYNEGEALPPRVTKIKFNGNQICPTTNVKPPSPVPLQHQGNRKNSPSTTDGQGTADYEIVDGVPCGQIEPKPSLLIANGQPTERGDWPWHAAIYESTKKDLKYICGGSVIGKQVILTAAHCVSERRGRRDHPVAPDSRLVFLGKFHLKGWEEGIQTKEVEKIHVHPEYSSISYEADMAILILSSPVEFTEYVKPVCLWDGNRPQLGDIVSQDGVVVGWGFDANGDLSESLMKGNMPVVSQQDCIWSNPQFFSRYTSDRTFCAGYRNGTSACNGDSGGGMFFPKKAPGKSDVYVLPLTWTLRGIVSLSVLDETKKQCNTKQYVIFSDVAKFYYWIKQYM